MKVEIESMELKDFLVLKYDDDSIDNRSEEQLGRFAKFIEKKLDRPVIILPSSLSVNAVEITEAEAKSGMTTTEFLEAIKEIK